MPLAIAIRTKLSRGGFRDRNPSRTRRLNVKRANKNRHPRQALVILALLSFLVSAKAGLAAEFRGVVHDPQGQPVGQATVRLQGTPYATVTGANGRFKIITATPVSSKHVTAWKKDFYNAGQPVSAQGKEYQIVLKPIRKDDNKNYAWLSSLHEPMPAGPDGKAETKPCQACHPVLAEQWRTSSHGVSATNPLFLAFFNGTDRRGKKDVGPGYKVDFQNSNGNCATCHVPALALRDPFDSDPNKAAGVEKEGVSCDLCHKIDEVRVDQTGGYPGTLSLQFKRPAEGQQIFYGPYDDVFPGDDSFHPLYKESRYCAPCHHGKFWGLPVYSEFQEWADSDYPAKNIHCQDCHMAADGKTARFASEKEGGVERQPATIPSHGFSGVTDRAFMAEAIDLAVQTEQQAEALQITITLKNLKAGHHYPSGNPMRNMILLVDAIDSQSRPLTLLEGEKVPGWGGSGAVEDGNYAGLPGKGFAKVLREPAPYPGQRQHFRPEYPAPHWRPAVIESDNRIPAKGSDVSTYRYRLPAGLHGPIRITARLIYRRAYKKWLDSKGFTSEEMEIARQDITTGRKGQ